MGQRIEPGMIVRTAEGREGVTVPDFMSCCLPSETPVAWSGEDDKGFFGTETETLTVVGPENPKPDMVGCGAGRGAECCIFMTLTGEGFACERHTSMRYNLIFKVHEMSAQRQPSEPYPACKKFQERP